MNTKKRTKLIRESDLVAEVTVDLIESPDAWAPYLSVEDAQRLDEVRLALRRGDLATAARLARIYRLTPIDAV